MKADYRKLSLIFLVSASFFLVVGSAGAKPVRITRKNISEFVKVNRGLYCRSAQARLGALSSRRLRPGSLWRPIKVQRLLKDYSKQLRAYQKAADAPSRGRLIKSLRKKISGLNEANSRCENLKTPECSDGTDNDGDGLIDWEYDLGCYSKEDPTEGGKNNTLDNGWTVFEPSAGTIIIYISSSLGDDSYNGLRPAAVSATEGPKKSLIAAMNAMKSECALRNQTACDYGCSCNGWFLLRRGDVFDDYFGGQYGGDPNAYGLFEFSGLSPEERIIIASYGESDTPPLLKSTTTPIEMWHKSNIAVLGLDTSSYYRDPASPDFNAEGTGAGISFLYNCQNILIEGNKISFRSGGMIVQKIDAAERPGNISIRRNVITDSYSASGSHSQGIYASQIDNLTLEENIFDHNGWNAQVPGGQATMFNHNIYFDGLGSATIRNNVFLRSSSMQNKYRSDDPDAPFKNLVIENNFYYDGEIGISLGGNEAPLDTIRYEDVLIKDNVFLNLGASNPTGRHIAWGIGMQGKNIRARNNFLLKPAPDATNARAVSVGRLTGNDVTFDGNTVYNWSRQPSLVINTAAEAESISISANTIVDDPASSALVQYSGDFSKTNFSHNRYFCSLPAAFLLNSASLDYNGWLSSSGETNSLWGPVTFSDPGRSLESYMAGLGEDASAQHFFDTIRTLKRTNWPARYNAPAINDYLRQGFSVQ